MKLNEKERVIFNQRDKRYGNFIHGHTNLGLEWTGILQNYFGITLPKPIPAHVVLLMMVASKINRAAAESDFPDLDNYTDTKIYMEMAKDAKALEKLAKQMPATEKKKGKPIRKSS